MKHSKRLVLPFSILFSMLTLPLLSFGAVGDLVGQVTFSQNCASGVGVGLAYDGSNLWYSCYQSSPDLFRANPITGVVTASYNIAGGLGALAYDATRNVIFAGVGIVAPGTSGGERIYKISLDNSKNVTGSVIAFTIPGSCDLDDGLAFDANNIVDPSDDVLYYSNDCGTMTIRKFDLSGNLLESFPWAGNDCYNSGLAIGGQLLYQGSDGCSHVWVVDKITKAPVFNFSTVVAGDPNFRDEDLECDTNTFASLGKHVMWSKEAYTPMRAHAFEIPLNSCGVGGLSPITTGRMTGGGSIFMTQGTAVTHGFELHCNAADLPNNLEVNSIGKRFHLDAVVNVGCYNDPSIKSDLGPAAFNTISGSGTGVYNGSPATVVFVFTDAGEPGKNDTAKMIIKDASGNVVLSVAGKLQNGNQQAHK